ncbi:MAG: hypothetical protein ABR987_20855 [Terracidiphilus sp.]
MRATIEYGQGLVQMYRDAGQPWPASTHDMGEWAVSTGHFEASRDFAVNQCAELLSRSMREEYLTDAKGRRVRKYHAARVRLEGKQLTLWADIETAPRRHMELAFAQRRKQVVDDCRQLKLDVDSYNDSKPKERPIQIVFDFTVDLEELEQLGEVV